MWRDCILVCFWSTAAGCSVLVFRWQQEMCASQNTPVYIDYQTVKNSIYSNGDLDLWPNDPKINRVFPFHRAIMWSSLVKIQFTELKLSCRNGPVVKNHIYSNSDLDLWPNDPKINRVLPLPSLVKIRYTKLKLLCGNLCGCPPAAHHTQSHNAVRLETGV